jgi:subtilisin family serine protease
MDKRRLLAAIIALALSLGIIIPAGASASTPGKVEQALLERLSVDGQAPFLVYLAEQADLGGAYSIRDWKARGDYVYQRLTRTAAATQPAITARLTKLGVPFRSFWIVNALSLTGDASLVSELAGLPEVRYIELQVSASVPEPVPVDPEARVNAVEWNLAKINAPGVWADFGDTGEDIVVANIDTGVAYTHAALVNQYRGNLGTGSYDHNYNWFDPAGVCGDPANGPCDNNNHGTHTMGTMVGYDGGENQIGVAPGAKWIAAKGCESSSCSSTSLLAAAQWILAPTDLGGANPLPEKRPHVVNNSWGGGGGRNWYQASVQAWVAAGIFPAFSNGNSGPSCGSSGSPGDYPESYASGAFGSSDTIASFSSRGPSSFGGVKPNISAPGVAVRSSVAGGGYAAYNGTSMASPHVAATVALIWSAAPSILGDVAATREILDISAIDMADESCGSSMSGAGNANNVWGEGRLDAYAALTESPIGPMGYLEGTVTAREGGQPLANAKVEITGPYSRTRRTDEDGFYTTRFAVGTYSVTVSLYGYLPATVDVVITEDATTVQDFVLDPAPVALVSGLVSDGSGQGWPLYARIDITTDGFATSVETDLQTGTYAVELLVGTEYTFNVSALVPGYQTEERAVTPADGGSVADFSLLVDESCTAPGYRNPGLQEAFEKADFPPDGWTVVDNAGNGIVWKKSSDYYDDNYTGGQGLAAGCNSDSIPGEYDTELITPPVDATVGTTLTYKGNFQIYSGEKLDLDISVDGDAWVNVKRWQEDHGSFYSAPGENVTVDLAPFVGSGTSYRLRWHYYNLGTYDWDWYAQVDDVLIGSCELVASAGLVVGRVADANTAEYLDRITVVDEAGNASVDLGDGVYIMAATAGTRTLIASTEIRGYGADTGIVDVAAGVVNTHDFEIPAPWFAADPAELTVTLRQGSRRQFTVELANQGTLDGGFALEEVNFPVWATSGVKVEADVATGLPGHAGDRTAAAWDDPGILAKLRTAGFTGWAAVSANGLPEVPSASGGNILGSWIPDIPQALWGIGANTTADDLWIGGVPDGAANDLYRYNTDGTFAGDKINVNPWLNGWGADITFNPLTGTLWQVDVDYSSSCLVEIDPMAMTGTGNRICPPLSTSQRGVAFDPGTQTYLVGSWNDFRIHRISASGGILESVWVGLAISGLAYNPGTGHLFALVNGTGQPDVYVLDVNDGYAIVGAFHIGNDVYGLADFNQAGLEIDCEGHLWVVDQGYNRVLEVESGETGVCEWRDIPWLTVAPDSGNVVAAGSDSILFDVDARELEPGTYTVHLYMENAPYGRLAIPVTLTVEPPLVSGDLDADASVDLAVYYPADGNWYIKGSAGTNQTVNWGWDATIPVPADYDADGRNDLAVYYPANGTWYVKGTAGTNLTKNWGWNATIPVPADWDNDGLVDIAVYYPSNGTWYIKGSAGTNLTKNWGWAATTPVPGDYDGDGILDLAVYYQSNGNWYVKGSAGMNITQSWGWAAAMPVPADWDGDGTTDLAVYYPVDGTWYIKGSAGVNRTVNWGWNAAWPVPADWDGDGVMDQAVYYATNGTWYIKGSAGVNQTVNWGWNGADPVFPQYQINRQTGFIH